MNYVMDSLKQNECKNDIGVIRLEIDYELMNLFDALEAKDKKQIKLSKMKLEELSQQLKEVTS